MTTIPVLLIDDSEPDRIYTGIVLGRSGLPFEVHDFESARDALAVLADAPQPPSLILLDINMPGMNGFAFLDAYEKLPEAHRRNTVVVMLSSSPADSDRQRALAHAVVKDYVVKPLTVPQARRLGEQYGPAA
jgi:CheY-like chemotaxis protein